MLAPPSCRWSERWAALQWQRLCCGQGSAAPAARSLPAYVFLSQQPLCWVPRTAQPAACPNYTAKAQAAHCTCGIGELSY